MKTIHLGRGLTLPANELRQRLDAKTARAASGCWEWTGRVMKPKGSDKGYGVFIVRGKLVYVHRASFALEYGSVPVAPLEVLHRCDNPPCWRPGHLFEGTQAVNLEDMRAKGRGFEPPRFHGEDHPLAKLTDEKARELFRVARSGRLRQRDIASMFGVSQGQVWQILHRRGRFANLETA